MFHILGFEARGGPFLSRRAVSGPASEASFMLHQPEDLTFLRVGPWHSLTHAF